jgi:predicted transglutaminase-like cysteine proteinase
MAAAGMNAAKPKLPAVTSKAIATARDAFELPVHFFSINRVLAEHDRRATASDMPHFASLNPGAVAADQALSPPPSRSDEPFGLVTFRAPEGALWAKWRGVEAEIERDSKTLSRCQLDASNCPSDAALRFIAMISETQRKAGHDKLEAANRLVNASIRYTSDFAQHGVADLWSAPLASFASGLGDCEDYAIAKYVLLRESGIAASDLRLLVVLDTLVRQDHAVLAAREDGRWFILDNRWTVVPESSEVAHLMPLFAIDHEGVRQFGAPYEVQIPHESQTSPAPAASSNSPASGGRSGLPLML